ncbi:MAG: helix-turn-helix domain-containing protein [Caulobacterales bacterium]|uniref:helix-turn-helix domain-containing protein n=1 Tax=Glycocaulis sp. TaxID=1969725 RepID=UPI003FA0AFF8
MTGKSSPRSPNLVDRYVGIRIRLRRRVMQISQQALAEKLGVTFQQLQKYENGANRIGAGRLYDLARALEVPIGYFYEDFDPAVDPSHRTDEESEAISTFIGSREGVQLAQAFNRIEDPKVRRHILQLAGSLGTEPEKDA